MSLLKREPFAGVESMDELLAIAYALEQEAVAGYSELADRMRREKKPELVVVFERLIAEERQHLGNVVRWSEKVTGHVPDLSNLRWDLAETFDDEGGSTIAAELLSAYRAFSMAVRNEERAFLFWTYVAAQTNREHLREAAEQMARDELGHLATLRRERRRAFHAQYSSKSPAAAALVLPELELRLADHLEAAAGRVGGDVGSRLHDLARQARERSAHISKTPLGEPPLLRNSVPGNVSGRLVPLSEMLLDWYLDLGERLPDEQNRIRAQAFAAEAIQCRSAIRSLIE